MRRVVFRQTTLTPEQIRATLEREYAEALDKARRAEAEGLPYDGGLLLPTGAVVRHYEDGVLGVDEGESHEELEQRRDEYARLRNCGLPTT